MQAIYAEPTSYVGADPSVVDLGSACATTGRCVSSPTRPARGLDFDLDEIFADIAVATASSLDIVA